MTTLNLTQASLQLEDPNAAHSEADADRAFSRKPHVTGFTEIQKSRAALRAAAKKHGYALWMPKGSDVAIAVRGDLTITDRTHTTPVPHRALISVTFEFEGHQVTFNETHLHTGKVAASVRNRQAGALIRKARADRKAGRESFFGSDTNVNLQNPKGLRHQLTGAGLLVAQAEVGKWAGTHGKTPMDTIGRAASDAATATRVVVHKGGNSDHRQFSAFYDFTTKPAPKPAPTPKPTPNPPHNQEQPVNAARIDAVDLSHWQDGSLNFTAASNGGVKAVWHKATEATSYVDPNFARRRREVAAAGIPFGAYHFADPKTSGRMQAAHFLSVAQPKAGDLRPMLDFEDATFGHWSKARRTAWVKEWVDEVQKVVGEPPVIYTRFDLDEHFDCPLWVARYSNAMSAPNVPSPWKIWSIWQFSNGAFGHPNSVPGLGHCDINTFNSGVTVPMLVLGKAKPAKKKTPPAKRPADPARPKLEQTTIAGAHTIAKRAAKHGNKRRASKWRSLWNTMLGRKK